MKREECEKGFVQWEFQILAVMGPGEKELLVTNYKKWNEFLNRFEVFKEENDSQGGTL